MDDHIWSCCELNVGGQSLLSIGDVFSNLIHSLSECNHTVSIRPTLPLYVCYVASLTNYFSCLKMALMMFGSFILLL